jgi:pilus retraction protein PilT
METFAKIITACYDKGFSDLHMTGNHPLVCRRDGEVIFQKQNVLTQQYLERLTSRLLNERQLQRLRESWSVDLAVTIEGKRLRLNVFSTHRGVSIAVRFLPALIPDIDSLNLHPSVKDFCAERAGLLLICGSTGSGKTTTIAALINEINHTRAGHIVTLEDPIEYLFNSQKSFIEQRELGKHFHSYQTGLLDVLRQAPDVIVVGEMRSPETIQLCLDAAESGHLVIATMHAGSHEEAVHRLCSSMRGGDEHLRLQLSSCLVGVINQQLLYMPKLKYSVPVLSVLRNTKAIATLIRDNKLSQLDGYLESCKDKGMFTFEAYREDYLDQRKQFSPPPGRNAGEIGAGPTEHSSCLFNYNARQEAAANAVARPAAANGSAPLGNGGDETDIDDYISQLEQRSV